MSVTYTVEHHDELLGLGANPRTHPQIDQTLDNLSQRLAILEAKKWYTFETYFTADMVAAAIETISGSWIFPIELGTNASTGDPYNYDAYEHFNVWITGMQQNIGEAILLVPEGNKIWVTLPEDQNLWEHYSSGQMLLVLKWFK